MSSGSKYRKAIESVRQGLGKQRFLLAAAAAVAGMWGSDARAQTISLNFGDNGTMTPSDIAGAPGYAAGNWANFGGATGTAANQSITASDGTSYTGINLWWGSPNTWAVGAGGPTGDQKMMNGYLDSNASGTGANDLTQAAAQPYVAITGLSGAFLNGYKVILYTDGDSTNNRTAQYWLTSFKSGTINNVSTESELTPRVFARDNANFSGTYNQVPLTSNTGAGATAGNYIVFDGLNSSNFVLRAEEFLIDTPRAQINGIQIVASPILPTNDTEWAGPSGAWPNSGSWLGGVPNDSSFSANFLGRATGPTAVSLNNAVTVKKIQFNNTNSYTVSGSGSITISPNSGLGSITVASGSHSILVPVITSTTTTFDVAANSSLTLQYVQAGTNLLNKEGAGTMVLNGAAPWGAFAVNNGLLKLGAPSILNSGAVNGNLTGTIDMNGFSQSPKRLEGNPNITNSQSTFVDLNINPEIGALNVHGGAITGNINVHIGNFGNNGGIQGLAGNNTYTGVTTIDNYVTVRTQSNTALGSTNAGTVLGNGVVLSLWNSDLGNEPFTIDPASSLVQFQDRGIIRGPITYTGPGIDMIVDANSGVNPSSIQLLGNITGNVLIGKLGGNGLVLGGQNTFTQGLNINQGWLGIAGNSDAAVTAGPAGKGTLTLYDVGLRSISGSHIIYNPVNIIGHDLSGAGLTVDPDPAGGTNVGVLTLAGTIDLFNHAGGATQMQRRITTNADINFAGKVTGGGIIKQGNGTLILSNATNDFNGGLRMLGGKVSVSQDSNLGGTQPISFEGGMLQVTGTTMTNINSRAGQINFSTFSGGFDIADPANTFTVSQNVGQAGNPGFFRKDGAGTLVLSGSNQWTGGTTVNGGTLRIGTAASLPDSSAMTINGGLLDLNGFAKTFTSLNGTGGAIGSSAAGALGVTVNGGGTWAGGIQNGPGTGTTSLTKTGNAALVLTGNSTYTGATTISGGTLQVDGSLGNTAVSVGSGATLTGKGSIGGVVNVASNGTIAPLATQLSLGGLTLQGGAKLNFLLGDGAGSSLIQVNNANGLTLPTSGSAAISLAQGAGLLGSAYDLIRYNGTLNGNFANLSLATPTIGDTTFTLVNNPGAISIVVGTSLFTWTGATSGDWDTATANWKGAGTKYTAGSAARFDDTGAVQNVNLVSGITAGRLDVINPTKDYTFSGSAITAGSLNKQGAAKAIFNQNVTLSGGAIGGGVVQMNGSTTLVSAAPVSLGNMTTNPRDTSYPLGSARGGTLFIPNDSVADRFGATQFTLDGGTILAAKGGTAGAGSTTVQKVAVNTGMGALVAAPNGGTMTLNVGSLTRAAGATGTVDFRSAFGTLGGGGDNGAIKLGTAPTLTNGLIGAWATVGDNYASYDATAGVIPNATNIVVGDVNGNLVTDATSNVRDTSGKNLQFSGNATVNSLIASGDVSVPSGSTLTVNSGAVMFSGPSKWFKGGGSVQPGAGVGQLVVASVAGDQIGNTGIGGSNDHRIQWSIKENGTPLTVIKTGEGHLLLDAANNYTGGTIVNAGALGALRNDALGAITMPVTVRPGGSFDVFGTNQGVREFIVSGSGATMNNGVAAGAITNFGGGQTNAIVKLTLVGDTAVGGTGRWDLRTQGTNGAVLNGGTFTLNKVGTNTVSIVQPSSVSVGNIVIDGGVLSFENANNVMGSTSYTATVNAGGTLQFWNNLGGESQNKPIVLNGGIVTSENNPNTLTGPIQLAGPASGQLRANNALTVTNVVSGAGGFTKTGGNTLLFSANNTYTGPTNVNAGLFRVTGSIANSAVTVNSTGTFEAPIAQRVAGLTVNTGGLTSLPTAATPYALTVGSGTGTTSPFSIPGTGSNAGKVELNKNGMIVDVAAGGEAAAADSVRTAVLAAYNGGQWNGTGGLTSSQISASNRLAIGFGTPAEVPAALTNGGTKFFGSTVDASAVVVQTTIGGDATLDKAVNFDDLLVLASNYNTTGKYWAKGDFTYDGNVNFDDLLLLAKNYNQAMPTEPVPGASAQFEADMAAAFAAVPEPGSLALLGIGAAAMLGRRQRRVRKS